MTAFPALPELFASIDAKDTGRFLGFLAPDASFRFGNAAPLTGRAAIGEAVGGFFSSLKALKHRPLETWSGKDSLVCQGEVTYTRHDGSTITLPFVNVFRFRGGLIGEYLIYVDVAPLYAPPAA